MTQQSVLTGLDPNRKLQVSGGQGLRVVFRRRGVQPASERPDARRSDRSPTELPDLQLIAAGDRPIDLPRGPVRRLAPQRELLVLGTGGLQAIEAGMGDVEAIEIEIFEARQLKLVPGSRGTGTPRQMQLLAGPRPANWVPVTLADIPGQVFVGPRIGVVFHRPAGDKLRLQWLHRSKADILGDAEPGDRFVLTRPTVDDRPGPWYIAGIEMAPPSDDDQP